MSRPPLLRSDNHRRPRILVAPDKFKGSLTAAEAASAISIGILDALPAAEVTVIPVSDGGEGTIEALAQTGAEVHTLRVRGPLGREVAARWASSRGTAVIEAAQAAGLGLVDNPDPASAWEASSYGVGQLMREALDHGYRRLVLGLGGTAVTDGGKGMLAALGSDPFSFAGLDPRLQETEIVLACDVAVPFTGACGAAQMFSPQKGADVPTVARLEERMADWSSRLKEAFGTDVAGMAGAGAGGGLGAPLLALGLAAAESGAAVVGELTGLRDAVGKADLVVVAEGSLDRQSLEGKAPIAIAGMAKDSAVACIALAGRVSADHRELSEVGIHAAYSLSEAAASLDDAMTNAGRYLRRAAALAMSNYFSDSGLARASTASRC